MSVTHVESFNKREGIRVNFSRFFDIVALGSGQPALLVYLICAHPQQWHLLSDGFLVQYLPILDKGWVRIQQQQKTKQHGKMWLNMLKTNPENEA